MQQDLSVLISSSPILSHPSTSIIDETIASVRYHLPDAPIFLMLDGVREEQKDYTERYLKYIMNLVGKALFEFKNIKLVPFLEFTHQAGMAMKTLEMVDTPLILFLEHDTPLVERPINWMMLRHAITTGDANHIRLHYDEEIHPDHQHMILGKLTPNLIKCCQYHNRPALANADWFRGLLAANFTENSRSWVEDKVYSPISCAPWENYRLTIYDPEGTGQNMKRSRHTCGRGDDHKYDPIF
jgi:hypothetical protein